MQTRAATASDEQVAAALLPVLLHRINNTTQLLVSVRSLLGLGGELPPSSSNALANAGGAAHQEGWLLGVLAGGLGADVLLARHESDGLAPVLWLVRDALRRVERDLQWSEHDVPRLVAPRDANAPPAWSICWTIASLAWHAGSRASDRRVLRIAFERDGTRYLLRGDVGADDAWLALANECCARLGSGAACSRDGAAWVFELPRESTEPAREASRLGQ
jgi:hypothetical protein